MRFPILALLALLTHLPGSLQAQNNRIEGLPGLVVGPSDKEAVVPLQKDGQYYVRVTCSNKAISSREYLTRTNKFGRLTDRNPVINANHASHFAFASSARIRRFTTNTAVSSVVTNPNTKWEEIYLLSEGADASTFNGGCLDSFFIVGRDKYFVAGFLGIDTRGTTGAAASAFLTFATVLKETIENVSLAELDASDSSDALVDAKAIVDAYKSYETALARKRADFVTTKLGEGEFVIETGFSKITFNVEKHESLLLANEYVPFRVNARDMLESSIPQSKVPSSFVTTLKLSRRDLISLDDPNDEVQTECSGMAQELISSGYYSDVDRAYLLGLFLARNRAKPMQRVMCFEGAELTYVMLENERFRDLLAHRSKGGGQGAVFYANHYKSYLDAKDFFGWSN